MASPKKQELIQGELRHLRMSPRKVRLVADLVRGLRVPEAQVQLRLQTRAAAVPVLKLVNSVAANAHDRFKATPEMLTIEMIRVNAGPTLKRWMPRAQGRASQILKRTSHVELQVRADLPKKKAPAASSSEKAKGSRVKSPSSKS